MVEANDLPELDETGPDVDGLPACAHGGCHAKLLVALPHVSVEAQLKRLGWDLLPNDEWLCPAHKRMGPTHHLGMDGNQGHPRSECEKLGCYPRKT